MEKATFSKIKGVARLRIMRSREWLRSRKSRKWSQGFSCFGHKGYGSGHGHRGLREWTRSRRVKGMDTVTEGRGRGCGHKGSRE